MSWRDLAACDPANGRVTYADVDEHFFPKNAATLVALRVCHSCPVRRWCRADIDAQESRGVTLEGIFAGETPKQRAARRRQAVGVT